MLSNQPSYYTQYEEVQLATTPPTYTLRSKLDADLRQQAELTFAALEWYGRVCPALRKQWTYVSVLGEWTHLLN